MNAQVRWATVWVDAVGKPKHQTYRDAKVLLYSKSLLEADGYVVVGFLTELGEVSGRVHGVFGPPKDFGSVRGHLIEQVGNGHQDKICDWGILEWQDQTTRNQEA